ncbi:hypothetical protein D9M71_586230 [compost metagenome]
MRAAVSGSRKPGWKAIMKRKVRVCRARNEETVQGSSVDGKEGIRPPWKPEISAARAISPR